MPYQQHTPAADDPNKEYKLDINIRFGNITNLYQSLNILYNAFISKNQFHYEAGEVQEILARMTQNLNSTATHNVTGGIMADNEIKFNKTRIRSLSELVLF